MPFPECQRVIYGENPLAEVICQLRFPTILRIDAELPVAFQEKIRAQFPIYREPEFTPVAGLPKHVPPEIAGMMGRRSPHEFLTSSGDWKVSLTRDFVALTTAKYERWEEFKKLLEIPLETLTSVYRPAQFDRIGLRYRDLVLRSQLGFSDAPWSSLLKLHVAAELASGNGVPDSIVEIVHRIVIQLPDERGRVQILHGLAESEPPAQGELGYLIDSDFYTTTSTEIDDALSHLDYFNQQSGRLFRWCISDDLHAAMDPSPLE